jgi:hypothetical protein
MSQGDTRPESNIQVGSKSKLSRQAIVICSFATVLIFFFLYTVFTFQSQAEKLDRQQKAIQAQAVQTQQILRRLEAEDIKQRSIFCNVFQTFAVAEASPNPTQKSIALSGSFADGVDLLGCSPNPSDGM